MEDTKIIYDLVKETRDDVKALGEKLNTHILNTSLLMTEANAPKTFLKTLSTCMIWAGTVGGFVSSIVLFFFSHSKS